MDKLADLGKFLEEQTCKLNIIRSKILNSNKLIFDPSAKQQIFDICDDFKNGHYKNKKDEFAQEILNLIESGDLFILNQEATQ